MTLWLARCSALRSVTGPIFTWGGRMSRNGKLMTAAAAVIALLLVPVAAVAGTGSPGAAHHPVIIHVVEHAITDTVQ